MKSFKKLFFRILGAFGWQHAEKPLYVNGQPAFPPSRQKDIETVFIRVNDGKPFPLGLEGAIDYFVSVVFPSGTYKVLALTAGQMRVASEIKSAQELIASLERGHIINMRLL